MARPKAEVKKSLPNLIKISIHIVIAFMCGFTVAHWVVDLYGGTWPSVSTFQIVMDLTKKFGGWGAVYAGLTTLYELYRRNFRGGGK